MSPSSAAILHTWPLSNQQDGTGPRAAAAKEADAPPEEAAYDSMPAQPGARVKDVQRKPKQKGKGDKKKALTACMQLAAVVAGARRGSDASDQRRKIHPKKSPKFIWTGFSEQCPLGP